MNVLKNSVTIPYFKDEKLMKILLKFCDSKINFMKDMLQLRYFKINLGKIRKFLSMFKKLKIYFLKSFANLINIFITFVT